MKMKKKKKEILETSAAHIYSLPLKYHMKIRNVVESEIDIDKSIYIHKPTHAQARIIA